MDFYFDFFLFCVAKSQSSLDQLWLKVTAALILDDARIELPSCCLAPESDSCKEQLKTSGKILRSSFSLCRSGAEMHSMVCLCAVTSLKPAHRSNVMTTLKLKLKLKKMKLKNVGNGNAGAMFFV